MPINYISSIVFLTFQSGAIMNRVENIEQKRVDKLKEKAHTDDDSRTININSSLSSNDPLN